MNYAGRPCACSELYSSSPEYVMESGSHKSPRPGSTAAERFDWERDGWFAISLNIWHDLARRVTMHLTSPLWRSLSHFICIYMPIVQVPSSVNVVESARG